VGATVVVGAGAVDEAGVENDVDEAAATSVVVGAAVLEGASTVEPEMDGV
jgi:hypothetical protein